MSKDYLTLVKRLYSTDETVALTSNYQHFWHNRKLWKDRLTVTEIIIRHGKEPVAHLLAQYDDVKKLVYIGFIEFTNDISVVKELITKAKKHINQAGWAGQVYAPVNCSLWHHYRFQVEGERQPLFDLPHQPYYPTLLRSYFAESAAFHSYCLATTERYRIASPHDYQIDNYHHGMTDIKQLYRLTLDIFDDIKHHSQPAFEEFQDQFSYLSHIQNNYLLQAYNDSRRQRVVGMAFGLVNDNRLLIKTVGTIPSYRQRGVAGTLFNQLMIRAQTDKINEAELLYLADNRLVSRLLPPNCQTTASYVLFNTLK